MDAPLPKTAVSIPPVPQVLFQIVKTGDQISVNKPDGLPWFGVVDLLVGLLPELWKQAKSEAASTAPKIVAPNAGFVAQMRKRLRAYNGKV